MNGRRFANSLRIAALFLLLAAPCLADSFTISAGGNHDWVPTSGAFLLNGDQPLANGSRLERDFHGHADVAAHAGLGSVGVSAAGFLLAPPLETVRLNPTVSARASGTLVFSGPQASPAPFLTTRPTFHVDGTLVNPACGCATVAEATIDFLFTLSNDFTAQFTGGTGPNAPSVNSFQGLSVSGGGGALSVSGQAQPAQFLVVPGLPYTVSFDLLLRVENLTNGFPGIISFGDDFNSTVSWSTLGPVFDLPPGYTVNGFGLVDNRFGTGPAVAEPTSIVLLGAGVAGVALRRRRRRESQLSGSLPV
jgi:hypothetical protein